MNRVDNLLASSTSSSCRCFSWDEMRTTRAPSTALSLMVCRCLDDMNSISMMGRTQTNPNPRRSLKPNLDLYPNVFLIIISSCNQDDTRKKSLGGASIIPYYWKRNVSYLLPARVRPEPVVLYQHRPYL